MDPSSLRTDLLQAIGVTSAAVPAHLDLITPEGQLTRAAQLCLAEPDLDATPGDQPHFWLLHRRFECGAAEADALALQPTEDRWLPGPMIDALEALAAELAHATPAPPGRRDLAAELLRELLVNAVGHRSFDSPHRHQPVQIELFTDELRISSPGGLDPHVCLTGLDVRGRWSRNPGVMAILTRAGLAHQQGRGLVLAAALAPEIGYRLDLEARPDRFVAHLVVDPTALLRLRRPTGPRGTRQRTPKGQRERRILRRLAGTTDLSAANLATALDIPAPTIRACLKQLSLQALVEKTQPAPRAPNQTWRVTTKGRRWLAEHR